MQTDNSPTPKNYTETDAKLLEQAYNDRRIQDQINFYASRIREFEYNSEFTFDWSLYLVAGATFLSTVNAALGPYPALSLVVAILPLFAGLLASFEGIYGWGHQVSLYRDSRQRLERNQRMRFVYPEEHAPAEYLKLYPELVAAVEETLALEMSQWGQPLLSQPQAAPFTLVQMMEELGKSGQLPETALNQIEKILKTNLPPESQTLETPPQPGG